MVQQGAGDQQPASHAPAELVDLGVAAIAQVGDLQRAVDRRPSLASRHAVEVREHEQVLLDGQRDVEVVELRHHPHLRARLLRVLGQPEPSTSSSPSSAITWAVSAFIVVDLPAPLGPRRPTHFP